MRISDWSADVCSSDLTGLELPANVLGHEGDFSPDGMTYWATGLALGAITAIDVSDPTQPRIVYTGIAGFPVNHGVEFSADGRRMYLATIFPGGVIAYDISDIQDRVPSPRIHELGRVSWNPTSAGQPPLQIGRSDERRVGRERGCKCSSRWWPSPYKQKTTII